jgi:hypothetical protein
MTTIDQIQADLETHFINGRVHAGDGGTVHAPLISHIGGKLWMGGCIGQVRLPDDFTSVISLYPWEKYTLGPDTVRHEYRLYDDGVPAESVLHEIVDQAIASLQEGKTLIHCQAGLNRSGLISALALWHNPKRPEGVDMDHIINMLRGRRHRLVLCNPQFEAYLRLHE